MGFAQPTLISEGFGTGDGSKTYPIPLASQIGITDGAASYADGFPPLTRTALGAGGIPPNGEDINGILYTATEHIAFLNSGGLYAFDAGQASAIGGYPAGAMLRAASSTGFWLNQSANNSTNPDTTATLTGWYPLNFVGVDNVTSVGGTVVATPLASAPYIIVFTGNLTSNLVYQVPAWQGKQWLVASYATHNGFSITVQTTVAGTAINVPPGGYPQGQSVFVDNTGNLYSNNISTAGLAPLASPAFTGVPTAPTASASSNNTQIATTAQVQGAIALATAALAPRASPTLTGVPTVPLASFGTSNSQIASTAFVQAALAALLNVPIVKRGNFNGAAGVVTVTFPTGGTPFASIPDVVVTPNYASPDYGWIVATSITTTGFQYQNGNAGLMRYIATTGN